LRSSPGIPRETLPALKQVAVDEALCWERGHKSFETVNSAIGPATIS